MSRGREGEEEGCEDGVGNTKCGRLKEESAGGAFGGPKPAAYDINITGRPWDYLLTHSSFIRPPPLRRLRRSRLRSSEVDFRLLQLKMMSERTGRTSDNSNPKTQIEHIQDLSSRKDEPEGERADQTGSKICLPPLFPFRERGIEGQAGHCILVARLLLFFCFFLPFFWKFLFLTGNGVLRSFSNAKIQKRGPAKCFSGWESCCLSVFAFCFWICGLGDSCSTTQSQTLVTNQRKRSGPQEEKGLFESIFTSLLS